MKMNTRKIIINLIPTFLLAIPFLVFGEPLKYVALEPTAFAGFAPSGDGMGPFLNSVFRFGIAIAAALAVFMIAWGGVLYMTTDAWFGKEEAKGKIWNAIQGLLLALVSWLILYLVNPNIFSQSNLFINSK